MSNRDFPRNDLEKVGYNLVFHDDFDTDELDRTKWLPYYLPQWSNRKRSAANYTIKDSQLILQITQDQLPWCPEFNGDVKVSNLQTGVFSGPLGSSQGQHKFSSDCLVQEEQPLTQLFTPHYGYFELRAKGVGNPNNVCAFWMIGFEDLPNRSGEICPFELKGWHVENGTCTLGFGIHPFGDPMLEEEFFEKPFDIDPTKYHIYAVDWTDHGVDFYIDNKLIHRSKQSPQYPMQLMLNIYEIPSPESGSNTAPVYPSEFEIDYIRCYEKIGLRNRQ
ncbi:glycoside hydrolase family 16 protein [Paenibacillus ferrarius]|uniref:glycoside hydrolase family 16 protein n=1 Tax=Paenibacillus ferrarius TaxID=1469647 RepID=UPI003D278152